MRSIILVLSSILLLVIIALVATIALPADFTSLLGIDILSSPAGYVIVAEVVDGDTIKVRSGGELSIVRLVGIDTPETKHPSKPVQCFGLEAAQRLTELIAGKSVKLVADTTQDDQDKYGRLLRYVYVDDVLVNKQMITEGFAFEYTYSIPYIFQSEFKQAQLLAQETSAGLWGAVCDYKAPTPLPTTYVCDCTKPCAQMSSCSEAQYQYSTCGCQDRDGDGDGLACNSICR